MLYLQNYEIDKFDNEIMNYFIRKRHQLILNAIAFITMHCILFSIF